ncbi:MAG: LysR family transcriptional regulator [Rhodospirillales bacterium]|nr:LysR family transcriptional regulator [Rhodospirillales bacterium]
MSMPTGLDPDLLRAFAFIAEEGSFTRAAARVGRTQSAVSMQVHRLETLLGQKVLSRGRGGSVRLTAQGQYLLDRSRELLALNDEIWKAFRAPQVQGTVRLGTPDDYALRYLPQVLRSFADAQPAVQVEVVCAPSAEVTARLEAGALDLTLCSEGAERPSGDAVRLWRGRLMWITSERHAPHRMDPLPLSLGISDERWRGDCCWRQAAIAALDRAGRRWRMAYSSSSMTGSQAPVLAGLAVTVSPSVWLPEGLRALGPDEGLPELPDTGILLLKARRPRQPVTDVLAAHISETFAAEMRRLDRA